MSVVVFGSWYLIQLQAWDMWPLLKPIGALHSPGYNDLFSSGPIRTNKFQFHGVSEWSGKTPFPQHLELCGAGKLGLLPQVAGSVGINKEIKYDPFGSRDHHTEWSKSEKEKYRIILPMLACTHAKLLQYLTLCSFVDCSLPSSSVHGILQARILEWVAIPFSRQILYPLSHQGSPMLVNALQLKMWLLTFSQAHSLLVYTFQFHWVDDFIHLNASNRKMSGIMFKGRSPKIIHSRVLYLGHILRLCGQCNSSSHGANLICLRVCVHLLT